MFTHGLSGYTNYKCKCDVCRDAYREYNATKRPAISKEKHAEYHRNWKNKHLEEARKRDAEIHRKRRALGLDVRDPEKDKIYRKRHYEKHGDEIRAKARAMRKENNTAHRKYSKTSKGRVVDRNSQRRRRAAKLGSDVHHTESEWTDLLNKFGCKCANCGSRDGITRDHIVPLSLGGSDSIDNIQPLCNSCNCSKGNRSSTRYI